jgi:cytochrome c biogenesis protein CcdA
MNRWQPNYLFIIGFVLVLVGFILPFLMVLKVIEATFFLSFLSFITSIVGLFLGIIAVGFYIRDRRK